jgi:transmembrane protein 132
VQYQINVKGGILSTNQFYLFQVYARFLAKDHDSGRVSYFVSRRTWLKVTELVLTLMRVSDPRIASLRGKVLQGRSTGRTEVQVLSPITGKQNDSITKAL